MSSVVVFTGSVSLERRTCAARLARPHDFDGAPEELPSRRPPDYDEAPADEGDPVTKDAVHRRLAVPQREADRGLDNLGAVAADPGSSLRPARPRQPQRGGSDGVAHDEPRAGGVSSGPLPAAFDLVQAGTAVGRDSRRAPSCLTVGAGDPVGG